MSVVNHRIATHLDIGAPASRVWEILTDSARYPEWNPFIIAVDGNLHVTGEMSYRFDFLGLKARTRARVLVSRPESELRWSAHFLAAKLFNGEHYFELSPTSDSVIALHHGELFTGLLLPLAWPLLRRRGPGVYAGLNDALKRRAEGNY